MTKFLQELLTTTEPLFPQALTQLERATGNDGVDVRLIADITHKAHDVMRGIGLDPADTTARELYLALNAYAHKNTSHELFFDADFVLLKIENDVVSFNLIDVIENAHHELPFEKRMVDHGQRALRGEIVSRYVGHPQTSDAVVQQHALDAGLVQEDDQHYPSLKAHQASVTTGPHILLVGDIISDAFIKLSEEHAEVTTDEKGYKRLSFELGAKIPYDDVEIVQAVECSPNAAVSLTRLGLSTSLVSWLGDDETGKEMVKYLNEQGVGTSELVIEKGMKSNYHYVLRYGADRTKLQKFEDYSYQWHEPARKPDWLYLGVLGEKTWPLHEALLDYLTTNADIKLVFQPGMYHLMWGTEKMMPFYKRAEIVILNREEAAQVTGKDRGDIHGLMSGLHELGVKVAVVTDGADGAYASDGQKTLFMPNYPDPKPPLDRTGAGDAFASTIAAALAMGESLETALSWAPINSMSVVQRMGAQAGLLSKDALQKFLAEAPDDYKASEVAK